MHNLGMARKSMGEGSFWDEPKEEIPYQPFPQKKRAALWRAWYLGCENTEAEKGKFVHHAISLFLSAIYLSTSGLCDRASCAI
jgi:hypothetical protein